MCGLTEECCEEKSSGGEAEFGSAVGAVLRRTTETSDVAPLEQGLIESMSVCNAGARRRQWGGGRSGEEAHRGRHVKAGYF